MTVLTIALIGAPHSGLLQLASALNGAVKTAGWQILVVIVADADTPALQADLASFDLILLMGLEPTAQSRIFETSAQALDLARQAADQSIRAALADAAVPYRVLYGAIDERLAHALHAIESLLPPAGPRPRQSAPSGGAKNQPWVWICDKCSDPQCEHRLLTALLTARLKSAAAVESGG